MDTPTLKKCGICLIVKPLTDFPKREKKKGGYKYLCKKCKYFQKATKKYLTLEAYVRNLVRQLSQRKVKNKPQFTIEQKTNMVGALMEMALNTTHCPYTGEELNYKQNMQLDHKVPASRRPDLLLDPSNVQWVSAVYNRAKWNMTDEEFNSKYILRKRDS
jgi:5-methylcytosine-specific restriction endonuclease McrA